MSELREKYKDYNIPNVDASRVVQNQSSVDDQMNALIKNEDIEGGVTEENISARRIEGGEEGLEFVPKVSPPAEGDEEYLTGTIPTWLREREAEQTFDTDVMGRADVVGVSGIATQYQPALLTPAQQHAQEQREIQRLSQAKTLPAVVQETPSGPQIPARLLSINLLMENLGLTYNEAQRYREDIIKNYKKFGGRTSTLRGIKDRRYGGPQAAVAALDPTGHISAVVEGTLSGVEGLAKLVAYSPRLAGIYTTFFRTEGNVEPSFFLRMATSPLSWRQGMSRFHEKMGDNTVSDMEARINEMPASAEKDALIDQIEALKAIEGPNAFWEIWRKLIVDHHHQITAWDDISNFGKVFYPQAIGDAVADGIHSMVAPIHELLEIPEDQKDIFHDALTFGGSMIAFTPATLTVNLFKLGAVAVGRGTQQVAKLGLPYLAEGNKIYNVLKPFTDRIRTTAPPWGKPALFDIPKAAKGVGTINKELLNSEVRLALGGGVGFATGDALFGGKEYDSMKYLMGIAGGISSLMKHRYDPTMRSIKGTWRVMNGIAHAATWTGHKVGIWSNLAEPLTKGQIAGWTNAFLRSRGFTSKDIKNMHHESQTMYDNIIKTEDGIEKAKKMGLAISDGRGGYTANLNFAKSKYLATNKKEVEFYGQILKEIDELDMTDPRNAKFKEDLRTNMNRGYRLFQKLASGLKGTDDIEKMEALGATISDLVALNNVRNYQQVLISKLNLGLVRGGWKKGHLITQLEKIDRQLDLRIDVFKETLKNLKLGPDAGDIHKSMNEFFQNSIKEAITAKTSNKFTVTRMLKTMQNKVLQKFSARSAKELESMKDSLRIGEYGVYSKEGGIDAFAYASDNFLYGRMVYDDTTKQLVGAPTKGHTVKAYKQYTQTGLYLEKRAISDDVYTGAFKLTRGDNNEILFHLDANPLFRAGSPLEGSTPLARSLQGDISEVLTREAERAIYKNISNRFTEAPLLESFRRRGLQQKRKELGDDDYQNYLEKIFYKNEGLVRKKGGDDVDDITRLEEAILSYEGHLDDVPALMTLEEWHFLRSRLNQMKTQYFNQGNRPGGNMLNYEAAKEASQRFETLFDDTIAGDKTGLSETIRKALQKAQEHYKATIVPWHNFKTRDWLKENVFPENYFASFFAGGMAAQGGNKRLFHEMFFNPATGKMDEKAVDFLRDALGKAYTDSGGDIASSAYNEFNKVWKPIFLERYGKTETNRIFNVLKRSRDFKEELLYGGNTKQFYQEQKDRINKSYDSVLKWFDEMDSVTATALSESVVGKLAGYLGPQNLHPSAKAFITAFSGSDSLMKRELLYDFLLATEGTGQKSALGISYGMETSVREGNLALLKETLDQGPLAMRQQAAETMEYGRKALPSGEFVIDTPLTIFIKHLDDKVAAGEMTSKEVEGLLDGLRTILAEEVLWRNFNYTKRLKITSSAERAKEGSQWGEKFNLRSRKAMDAPPILDLRQDIDIVGMRTAFENNLSALKVLYGRSEETRKQFNHLKEMMELSVNMRATTPSMTLGGVPTDITFSMAMGRMYNAMKGVMSVRYLIMEGGAIQARKVHADLFLRMFTDPSAALIAKEVFMSSKPQEKFIKAFKKILERSLGYELNDKENHALMRAVTASRTAIVTTAIWSGWQSKGAAQSLKLQQLQDYPPKKETGWALKPPPELSKQDVIKQKDRLNAIIKFKNEQFRKTSE